MGRYYHIQRDHLSTLRAGKAYTFGAEPNFYSQNLRSFDLRFPVGGVGTMSLDAIIQDYLDPTSLGHHRHVKKPGHMPGEKGLLQSAVRIINHQNLLLREFAFEEVRREEFPEKPSRLRCIWLIPHRLDALESWTGTVRRNSFRVFELEANGSFHCGWNKYLQAPNMTTQTMLENARRYWSEEPDMNSAVANIEVLCAGTVEVKREVKVDGSKEGFFEGLKKKLISPIA